jgi:hypothetical protein
MYGIEAINAANGWSMALAGAMIVLTGLSVLSFIISRLHKIIGWAEGLKGETPSTEKGTDIERALAIPQQMPTDLNEIAGIYQSLSVSLGSAFELTALYRICAEHRLPHPHLTIRSLREAGVLILVEDGVFSWSAQ